MTKLFRCLSIVALVVGLSTSNLFAQQVNYDCVLFPLFPLDEENWAYICEGVNYNPENTPACTAVVSTLWFGLTDLWPAENCPDDCEGPRLNPIGHFDPLSGFRKMEFVGHTEEISATTGTFKLASDRANQLFKDQPLPDGFPPLIKARISKTGHYRYFRVFCRTQQIKASCCACVPKDRYIALEVSPGTLPVSPSQIPVVVDPKRLTSNKGEQPMVWEGRSHSNKVLLILKKPSKAFSLLRPTDE
ncbi:MAG: hypothetical protein KF844_09265 [Cryobacterium sp.]|nr:hypothetical protein [Cryobacterium sp.]